MEFQLLRSKRKTLSIEIDRNAKLIVKAPYLLSKKHILQFLSEKEAWIKAKQEKILNEDRFSLDFNEKILFLGQYYSYAFSEIYAKYLFLEGSIRFPIFAKNNFNKYLLEFYKKEAYLYFLRRLSFLADKMSLEFSKLSLSSARSRWGSCNYNQKKININWKLILLKEKLIDYVLVHELAHLKHPNHSDQFWNLVFSYYPEYNFAKAYLKQHSYILDFLLKK